MDTPQPVKYSPSFKQEADKYMAECEQNKTIPTIKGFATRLGTDVHELWVWANKKKVDEQGKETEELFRPNFLSRLNKIKELEDAEKADKLEPKQELFCQLYATDREFFGNGVQSYIEVYEPDKSKPNWYKTACAVASEILSNPKVFSRINQLLEEGGLNDVAVDKQLQFLLNQHASFDAKLGAIREYNKLKKRITEKMDILSDGKQIVAFNLITPKDGTNNPNT